MNARWFHEISEHVCYKVCLALMVQRVQYLILAAKCQVIKINVSQNTNLLDNKINTQKSGLIGMLVYRAGRCMLLSRNTSCICSLHDDFHWSTLHASRLWFEMWNFCSGIRSSF
jgi:hypothetical protein